MRAMRIYRYNVSDILDKSNHIDKITKDQKACYSGKMLPLMYMILCLVGKNSANDYKKKMSLYMWNPHINIKSTNLISYNTIDSSSQYQLIVKS